MNTLIFVLLTLSGSLIGSSASPFLMAALQPRDEFSAAPVLIRFGVRLVLVGAALGGIALLTIAAQS